MKSNLQVFFYSTLSGILLSLAIPNELFLTGCPVISFIAIVPYYHAIKNCRSYKNALICGGLQAITTHLLSSFWLAFFKDFAIFTLGGSGFAMILHGCFASVLLYLPFSQDIIRPLNTKALSKKYYLTKNFRIFYFASGYVIYEFIKSSGFLGYPWGTVSSSMYNFPLLMQLASITGTYGVTFIVVIFNCILEELIQIYYTANSFKKSFYESAIQYSVNTFLVCIAICLIYGSVQYNKTRTPVKQLTGILVQSNQNPWDVPEDYVIIENGENLTQQESDKLSLQNKKPQLVVWSEGMLQLPFPSNKGFYKNFPDDKPLTSFIDEIDAPFIMGGSTVKRIVYDDGSQRNKYYNAALVFDKDGEYAGSYEKLHLVPFAELIPGIENPFIYKFITKVVRISNGWAKGENLTYFDIPCTSLTDQTSFPESQDYRIEDKCVQNYSLVKEKNTPFVKIAIPICYDDAFTDTMRPLYNNGAELFVNISDDSWSLKNSSEYQHFTIAAYRAIEYRTTLVRSTNAGYTVVVNPAGKLLADLPLFQPCSLSYDIPVYERQPTTYSLLGNWFSWLCVLFVFLSSILKIKISQE